MLLKILRQGGEATTLLRKRPEHTPTISTLRPGPEPAVLPLPAADREFHTHFRCMYVYLTSGAVEVVPFASTVTMTDRTVLIEAGEGRAVEYPRAAVYFVSREPISPPVMF